MAQLVFSTNKICLANHKPKHMLAKTNDLKEFKIEQMIIGSQVHLVISLFKI